MSDARIVSSVRLGSSHLGQLADWDVRFVDFSDTVPSDLDAALALAEGLLIDSHVSATAAVLARAPHLRALSTVSVGVDHIDLAETSRRAITVTHTPVLSDAVADLTLALILMQARRLREAVDIVSTGGWDDALLGADLRAKTLLVVGLGRIGREVARRALAFKMQVCGFDVRSDLPPVDGVERVSILADGLARADVVSLHVDLNPTTRHLFDDEAFSKMKPTAFIINTARGAVIDQVALTRALAEHRIGGAGLDVLEVEPPGPGEPLLNMPNVVVLPHIGSATVETRRAMLDCAVDNLAACLRNEHCDFTLSPQRAPT
jgi:lactate dehydrogenase-like 2-hydroxyacid dehydrogenase